MVRRVVNVLVGGLVRRGWSGRVGMEGLGGGSQVVYYSECQKDSRSGRRNG